MDTHTYNAVYIEYYEHLDIHYDIVYITCEESN